MPIKTHDRVIGTMSKKKMVRHLRRRPHCYPASKKELHRLEFMDLLTAHMNDHDHIDRWNVDHRWR
jgi:hypothetical protein